MRRFKMPAVLFFLVEDYEFHRPLDLGEVEVGLSEYFDYLVGMWMAVEKTVLNESEFADVGD
jgi:hypothetical protein